MSRLFRNECTISKLLYQAVQDMFTMHGRQCHFMNQAESWTVYMNWHHLDHRTSPTMNTTNTTGATANLLVILKGGTEIREKVWLPVNNTAHRMAPFDVDDPVAEGLADLEQRFQQEFIDAGIVHGLLNKAMPQMLLINDLFDPSKPQPEDTP